MVTGMMDGNFAKQQVTFLSHPWQALKAAWIFYCHRWSTIAWIVAVPLLWRWFCLFGWLVWPAAFGRLFWLMAGVIDLVALLVLIYFVAQDVDRHYDWRLAYRRGSKLFWSYLLINLLVGLVILGAGILAIIPGLVLAVYLVFSSFTLVDEHKTGWSALLTSWRYVTGYWWAVLGRLLFFLLWAVVAGLVVSLVAAAVSQLLWWWSPVSAQLIRLAVLAAYRWLVLWPVAVIYLFYIYNELKYLRPRVEIDPAAHNGWRVWLIVFLVIGLLTITFGRFILVALISFLRAIAI